MNPSATPREKSSGREPEGETVFLGLGSNLGDREGHLRRGLAGLGEFVRLEGVSGIYDSAPVGGSAQRRFLNLVVRGRTRLSPRALLRCTQEVEARAGRARDAPRNDPRTLDVDILFYGAQVISEEGLEIPHPRWRERAFVLLPLREVGEDWVDPGSGDPLTKFDVGTLEREQDIRVFGPPPEPWKGEGMEETERAK